VSGDDTAIQARAEAARQLIATGEFSPEVALSYVVWPTASLADIPGRMEHDASIRQRALELVDAGLSQAQAGAAVGVPRTTIQTWVRQRRVAA